MIEGRLTRENHIYYVHTGDPWKYEEFQRQPDNVRYTHTHTQRTKEKEVRSETLKENKVIHGKIKRLMFGKQMVTQTDKNNETKRILLASSLSSPLDPNLNYARSSLGQGSDIKFF